MARRWTKPEEGAGLAWTGFGPVLSAFQMTGVAAVGARAGW